MDLWLKSQTSNLIKVDNIFTGEADGKAWIATLSHDEEVMLGEYSTKERALEVLDEIQKLLMGQNIMLLKNTGLNYEESKDIHRHIKENQWVALQGDAKVEYISPSTIVYEMPLD